MIAATRSRPRGEKRVPLPVGANPAYANIVSVLYETVTTLADGHLHTTQHQVTLQEGVRLGLVMMAKGKVIGKKAGVIIELPPQRPYETVFAVRPTRWTSTGPGLDDGFNSDSPWPNHARRG